MLLYIADFINPPHHAEDLASRSPIFGFKLVGDNIDKNVKARYQRQDHQNKSLHYFNSFALQSRIDFSELANVLPATCVNSPHNVCLSLLPSVEDDKALRHHFITLVSHILMTHMQFFKISFDNAMDWHTKHKYYKEMSSKSVVVSQ